MSAIWGIIRKNDKLNLDHRMHDMFYASYQSQCMVDEYTHLFTKDTYMGCAIQKVRDIPFSPSPLVDASNRYVFAADCLLDNRDELCALLKTKGSSDSPDPFDSSDASDLSDDELILKLFLLYKEDCFSYLRGLYSVAIYDNVTGELLLSSDPVSARCLYYAHTSDFMVFSTLLTPLREFLESATGCKIAYNEDYFKDFLLADPSLIYVVPGETPYKDIYQLPPATICRFRGAEICATSYQTRLHISDATTGYIEDSMESSALEALKNSSRDSVDPEALSRQFMSLYSECVKDAMASSGEVGIALSSGLDSSGIAVLAVKELSPQGKDLYAYTFTPCMEPDSASGLDGNAIVNESELIRQLCLKYPQIKPHFLTNEGKNCFADMETCTGILEMPYKSGAIPNHLEICKKAQEAGCRILLNGAFGNSTVSYGELLHILYDLYLDQNLDTLVSYLKGYCEHQKIPVEKALKDCLSLFAKYQPAEFDPDRFVPSNPFLQPTILKDYAFQKRFTSDPRTLSRQFIDHTYYPVFLNSPALLMYLGAYETKFGLAHNLILRDPTKDIRLIEFCNRLPYFMFAYMGETRWLTRHGFRSLLPSTFLENQQQHAYLNADWIERVKRDWEELYPQIKDFLMQAATIPATQTKDHQTSDSHPQGSQARHMTEYLSLSAILNYLEHLDFADQAKRNQLKYVTAIYNCLLFRKI